MLTNLLASVIVTLVTNTTERVPMRAEYPNPNVQTLEYHEPGTWNPFAPKMVPIDDPKEKWVTTTVTQHTAVVFTLDGHLWNCADDQIISNKTVHFTLKRAPDSWIPDSNTNIDSITNPIIIYYSQPK